MVILPDNTYYDYLEREKILPEEQKVVPQRMAWNKDQLLIDKGISKDCRKRHTNVVWLRFIIGKRMIRCPIAGLSNVWRCLG